ncbi:MAG: 30S ribosomal protein S6 [Eubacteriales bacterium]
MAKYESMYILKPNMEDEKRTDIINKFSSIVENNGGKVEKVDEWGLKKLAYAINYITEGYYVLMDFEAGSDVPAELNRNYKISDEVLRYIVINKEN